MGHPAVRRRLDLQVSLGWIFAGVLAYLGADQLLLWRFLGLYPAWAYAGGALLTLGSCVAVIRAAAIPEISLRALLCSALVATTLLLLGGEGRLFYANVDWQVRDAVLRDMSVNPWPFVYTARPAPDVLRAPLGMFLVPALVAKATDLRAADWTLLLQNAALVTALLAAASRVFQDRRERVVALAVFLGFSGLDILGALLLGGFRDHLEGWAGVQYSSTATLAFWVPQHAIAGWLGAVAYLLWREGRLPLALVLAPLPLTALWSPLALMGSLPFAALAVGMTIWRRALTPVDMLLPALTSGVALPGLFYLGAANHEVGFRPYPIAPALYLLFEMVETFPYLVPLALALPYLGKRGDGPTLFLAALFLMLAPLIQIGWSVDFAMRASIPALAIIAALVARLLLAIDRGPLRPLKVWTLTALAIGAMTGGAEVARALTHPAAPRGRCSFFKAWDQSFGRFPKGSYLAPLAEMPAIVRPADPALVSPVEPTRCWDGSWYKPTGV